MNGQTPPRRKRPTRPDPQPTETPRPTRRKAASAASAATTATAPKASRPKSPPAPEATPAAPVAVLPDRSGDVSVAITPRQMAFLALIAAVILAILRRLAGRRRGAG